MFSMRSENIMKDVYSDAKQSKKAAIPLIP